MLSEILRNSIASYIEKYYIDEQETVCFYEDSLALYVEEDYEEKALLPQRCATMAAPRAFSLEEMLRQEDAGFTETLLRRIDSSGKKMQKSTKKPISPSSTFPRSAAKPIISLRKLPPSPWHWRWN